MKRNQIKRHQAIWWVLPILIFILFLLSLSIRPTDSVLDNSELPASIIEGGD